MAVLSQLSWSNILRINRPLLQATSWHTSPGSVPSSLHSSSATTTTTTTTTRTCRTERRSLHTSPAVNAPPPKAKAGGAFKAGMTVVKKKMEVETDPQKIVNYLCGGNYVKDSPDIKLKPDSEYPDWLWNLRTNGPPTLEELDPNSLQYWYKVREIRMKEERMLQKAAKGKKWLLNNGKRGHFLE